MKRLVFTSIFILSLFAGKAEGQCVVVTTPPAVCSPATVDITAPSVTAGSSAISFAYFLDAAGTQPFTTPTAATAGTYYIQGLGGGGCPDIQPVVVTVNASVTASVSIGVSANNICSGTSVTFTPVPVNGGSSPAYQWYKNSTPVSTNPTYTYAPVNGDQVYVVMTSNETCVTGSPATSNTINMVVNTSVTASVTIGVSANNVCSGTSVTFTPTPVNGGSSPTYQWYKNSAPVSTNATYSYTPVNGDQIYVVMTSNATCVTGSPATSSPITMNVTAQLPVSVTIAAAPSGAICSGTLVTFTATPLNGGTPTYQWKVNGSNVGSNSNTFSSNTLANNDLVTVTLNSSLTCTTGNPDLSNTITMVVNASLPASVTIAAVPSGAICSGTSVIFTATPVNGGGSPSYQWKVNGTNVGTNSPSYTTNTLTNGQSVTVEMTSSSSCATGSPATSNNITMSVNSPVPASVSIAALPAGAICSGTSVTFSATPFNGGGAPSYQWKVNGANVGTNSATFASTTLATGDNVTVVMTSSLTCVSGSPATSNIVTMIVNPVPVATFSYATNPYCSSESNPLPSFTGGGVAGTFSFAPAGLVFVNNLTGQVNLTTSTPGTYTVTNTIAAAGGCSIVTASSPITITAAPSASISYSGSPWCTTEGVQSVTVTGTPGGTFSSTAGLTIAAATGAITTATSTPGTYVVIYTIPATGGCGSSTATTSVTISPVASAPVIGAIIQPTCSVATGSVDLSGLPATGAWTLTRNPGGIVTAGTGTTHLVTALAAGSYTFFVTNAAGCISPVSLPAVINAQPASPASPVTAVDCALGFNNAKVTVTSPIGAGLQYSLDGTAYQISPVFNLVANGSHYISITNAAGCTTTGGLFVVSCGCINPPTVTLSAIAGNTCGVAPVTVTGNTFGGTATSVAITHNGTGTVVPTSSVTSPFSFTYTPAAGDGGKTVVITVTTNNPLGSPCAAGVAAYTLTVHSTPTAPVVGTITNLSCSVATGSVQLTGLPSTGTWTLVRNPGSIITSGTGTTTLISGLVAGTYNFIVTSAESCTSLASADVVISPQPSSPTAPVVGTITQPTCAISTGSVALSGLPASGTWTLTRTPGGVTITGSGAATTVSAIPSGTYTFNIANAAGCISPASGNVVINTQPPIPAAPAVGAITPPTCTLSTGSVVLSGLPATGTWTLIRYPGTISTTGSGTSATLTGLPLGTYNYTVTTADGCLSVPSANVVIPAQPAIPSAPTVGTITQPTFSVPTGSVVLNGLPASGAWVITTLPGGATSAGSGTTKTISSLPGGVFTFTVTNSTGCTSPESVPVTISTPGVPVLTITDPPAVCSPATVNITNAAIITGSTPGLTYTYWTDAAATIVYATPAAATNGTYYIKGTTVSGYFNIKPVIVTVDQLPVANAGPDQNLDYTFSTILDATLDVSETGIWSLYSGSAEFDNTADPKTPVTGLAAGTNALLWSVKKGICPTVIDTVNIIVGNLVIPTLITPNMDGRNDYFIIKGLNTLGKTEVVIFDRRGAQIYKNLNYDNSWDGVDYNKNPLPDDTYFYVLKTSNGKSISGYIVIRR